MKNTKRRIEILSFYDHTGIEKHLEYMAEKGWMIEEISKSSWIYRRIEPQKLHFTVSYYPEASDFDSVPSESQQTFIDFCEKTRWELACTWFQMQIFYNSEAEPIPINTDPSIEVETIHEACMTDFLRSHALLFVISVINIFFFLSSAIREPLKIIASSSYLVLGVMLFILFFISSVELITYFIWYQKAQKAAEQEMFLETPSTSSFHKCMLGIAVSLAIYWIIRLAFSQSPWVAWFAFILFLCHNAVVILSEIVKNTLKRDRVSAGTNRILTLITTIMIAFVLFGSVSLIRTFVFPYISDNNPPVSESSLLQISDLIDVKDKDCRTMFQTDESVFLRRMDFRQKHTLNDRISADTPVLNYQLYTVKVPYIYNFCKELLLQKGTISEYWQANTKYQDSNLWGAAETYRFAADDETENARFLLCYDNRLVQIEFTWEPDAEQIAVIREQFAAPNNNQSQEQ